MKKKRPMKLLVGLLCVALLLMVAVVAVILDSQSPDPVFGIFRTETEPTQQTQDMTEGTQAPAEETQTEGTADPTESTQEPAKPTEEDPTKPTEEDPTKPTQEDSTKPTEEDPTEPTQEDPTKPTEEDPTEPTQEDPTKPTEEDPTEPTQEDPTEPTQEDPTEPTQEDPTEPTQEDPTEGTQEPTQPEERVAFPYEIPGYDLVVDRIAPYAGMFVEQGGNAQVENVAMLLVSNNGKEAVEYAQISVVYGQETLTFDVSALPAGQKAVVQEKTGMALPEGNAVGVSAIVAQGTDMDMAADQIQVTDNGDNTLTIRNLTKESFSSVRVFYKYYMEEEGLFVGGIAFTIQITRLGAGASVTVQPSHYTSKTCRVVMVRIYESEV